MRFDFAVPFSFLLLFTIVGTGRATGSPEDAVFLWSSTGGGWRSMFSCVAFANVFRQAGLFTQDSTKFQSIATNSGASWFSTQLFYSEAFYNRTVMAPTPYHLYNFTLIWTSAYYELALEAGGYRKEIIRDIIASFFPPPEELLGNVINGVLGGVADGLDALFNPNQEEEVQEQEQPAEAEESENNCQGLAGLACLFGPGKSLLPEDSEPTRKWSLGQDSGANISSLTPPQAATTTKYNPITLMVEFYDLYRWSNASWGYFMQDMMNRAAMKYGHPGDFGSIVANGENRITPMKNTNLLLQTTIAPESKVRLSSANYNYTETKDQYGDTNLTQQWAYLEAIFGDLEDQDMAIFLGPLTSNQTGNNNTTFRDVDVFSVGLSAYYLVNDTFEGFQYATHDSDSSSTVATYCSPTHYHFSWDHFEAYYLSPNEGFWDFPTDPPLSVMKAKQVWNYNKMAKNMTSTGTLRPAFGGGAANVIQAAAVSSAFAGPASPAGSPVFAQALSLIRQQFIRFIDNMFTKLIALSAFDIAVEQIYQNVLIDNGAVCSQWPKPCGPNDGYFMDGAFSDNPSVISNIAQYQNSADADLNKTIKLVMTNTNQDFEANTYDTQQLTQYFETDWNKDVPPGGYVWLPDFVVPYRSPQIFKEYLSDDDVIAAIEPIEGWNHTTSIYKGTTLNNPAFGIKAGQKVEILMINTNENITTFIGGLKIIEYFAYPMAEMSYKLAADEVLVERVRSFFFGDSDLDPTLHAEDQAKTEVQVSRASSAEPEAESERGAGPSELRSSGRKSSTVFFNSAWLAATVATTSILMWRLQL